jgi:hypothetical protein
MRQGKPIQECREQYTTNTAIEVFEGMNPLESPIDPSAQFSAPFKGRLRLMAEAFGEVVAELAHVDGHFVKRRRVMSSNLHVYISETTGPIGVQMASEAFVAKADPLGGDDDLVRAALKEFVVDRHQRDGEAFGQLLVRKAAFGGVEFASRP